MNTKSGTLAGSQESNGAWRIALGYSVIMLVVVGLIFAVLSYGISLQSAGVETQAANAPAAVHKTNILYHVLLALVSILLLGRWLGKLFVYFGQPRVIGEMVAGIAL